MSQEKYSSLLERLELNLDFLQKEFLNELKILGVFDKISDWKILDRAIGGGQLVSLCEKEFENNGIDPCFRVFGSEEHKVHIEYAKYTHKLVGSYTHTGSYIDERGELLNPRFNNISFLPGERNFKYIELGNYPYNDGSVNNSVIWNKFIDRVHYSQADAVGVVVQASFLSQSFKGMSKAVKQKLISLGCYKVIINDYSDFPEDKAKVKTCIIFCKKGYSGLVEFVERKTGHSVKTVLDKPFDMIFDPAQRQFVNEMSLAARVKTERKPKWSRLSEADQKKWCIGSYYRTEGFDKNPLKPFTLLDPNSDQSKDNYVIFGISNTEDEAKKLLEELNSFWFSDPVQAFLMLTRYQISLDLTQYVKVPCLKESKVFTNEDLYELWNISTESQALIKELVKNCNHKKKTSDDENI